MPQITRFHPRHLEVMEVRDHEMHGMLGLADAYERMVRLSEMSTEAGTFLHDGRIIACAGFAIIWPGVIDGWIIPSKHIDKSPVFFAKYMKRYIEATAKCFKAHRFQTTSLDDAFHERWMTWLGFQKEGTLRNYTSSKVNYCIYGRLFI